MGGEEEVDVHFVCFLPSVSIKLDHPDVQDAGSPGQSFCFHLEAEKQSGRRKLWAQFLLPFGSREMLYL